MALIIIEAKGQRMRYLIVLTALSIGLLGCSKAPEPAAASNGASLTVSLVPAKLLMIERTIRASGPIAAWQDMVLGVELSGQRVTELNVEVGQRVRKGEVLLALDARTLRSELAVANAALTEARAGLELARLNLTRGQTLRDKKLLSQADLDSLTAAQVQAQARLETTLAQADGAQLRLSFTELRAPDDGVIAARNVRPGEVVSAGAELLRLIRNGRLEWRAELNDTELAQLTIGSKAVLADGIEGTVRAITPGVDARTRTGTVYVDLPEPGALKAGSFVEGSLAVASAEVVVVPDAALVRRDGYAYVYTVTNGLAKRVRVEVGASTAQGIEITQGLVAPTAVVARGAGFLSDGDRVRVVAADSGAAP